MSQTQTLVLAIGAFQCLLLFTLLVTDKRVNYASKLLGVQCLFIASTFVLPLIVAAGESKLAWLIGLLWCPDLFVLPNSHYRLTTKAHRFSSSSALSYMLSAQLRHPLHPRKGTEFCQNGRHHTL